MSFLIFNALYNVLQVSSIAFLAHIQSFLKVFHKILANLVVNTPYFIGNIYFEILN